VDYAALTSLDCVGPPAALEDPQLAEQVAVQVDVRAKYSGYIERQQAEIERHLRHEETLLPADLDYLTVPGLSNEARQRLAQARPPTIGAAGRIPGMTPAAVSLLLIHLKKRSRAA
jgi:tRNA uridine 5-carboxymethylaminomethyl modification enzyme